MRLCPHLGRRARGLPNPCGDHPIARYVRPSLCVCARWTPERRSRFSKGRSGDRGTVATPGSASRLEAGVILRGSSWRIPRSASSRIRELISLSNVHCEIVHRVGSDFKGAGCVTRPASEISLGESCPTHLGCMLGLMLAEQIRQDSRSSFKCLSQREAGVRRGIERPRVARVGLVIPALSLGLGRCCGHPAAV